MKGLNQYENTDLHYPLIRLFSMTSANLIMVYALLKRYFQTFWTIFELGEN